MAFNQETIINDLNLSLVEKKQLAEALVASIKKNRVETLQRLAAEWERESMAQVGMSAKEVLAGAGKKRGRPGKPKAADSAHAIIIDD